ncbi:MAG TPA: type II secretion system protein GspD, partial [Bacteroidetes bacterium]|nr:type II secretion system protein GspD [Bacteroidota bacterium]
MTAPINSTAEAWIENTDASQKYVDCTKTISSSGCTLISILIEKFSIYSLIIIIFLTCPASSFAQSSNATFETRNTIQLAQSLLKDHRYLEVVSLLRNRLETLPQHESRLPLLLLLADGLMGLGDLTEAETALDEVNDLIVHPAEEKALMARREKLAQLASNVPSTSLSDKSDTLYIPLEVIPEERIWPTITNSFFETDIRQVLIDLSMEAGVPILWDATVQGLVTYEAVEQPLEEVLKAILFPAGYTYTYKDGAYYVGSVSPDDPAFGLLSATDVISLSNLDATEAIGLLSDYFKPYVKASKTANLVCITAPPTWIERIREDLVALDAPPDQILIEVIITEIARDALREMGLDWSMTGLKENPVWNLDIDNTDIENPGVLWDYSEMGVDIGDYTIDLIASLEALVQSGDAKIRANPRITTLNGRTAEISLTKDQYFIIQTGTSQYYQYNTLQAVSTGIKLEITPYTAESGEITVYVKPEVGDVVGKGANDLPEISTRSANTSVRVMDGETFTIGGLSLQQEKNIQKKIPFLGDIPILGYFFRYDKKESK